MCFQKYLSEESVFLLKLKKHLILIWSLLERIVESGEWNNLRLAFKVDSRVNWWNCLSNYNWTRTQNHLVCKWSLNHLSQFYLRNWFRVFAKLCVKLIPNWVFAPVFRYPTCKTLKGWRVTLMPNCQTRNYILDWDWLDELIGHLSMGQLQ